MTEHQHQKLTVSKLVLDPENPRFFNLKELEGRSSLSQDELLEEIASDDETITLTKAIRKSGVKDPIWVKEQGDGSFLVIEGNRRTTVLKKLLQEKVQPPPNVRYDVVDAHVLPEETPETELLLQKARLQSGKKKWGPFNEAAVTYKLRHDYEMEFEDIAAELQISVAKVKERIQNYLAYLEYSKTSGDSNPGKFAFFSDAPPAVRNWVQEKPENKETYFKLITPTQGKQKIRSATTKGGLRDFAKVIEDPEALKALVKEEDVTVEEALEIAKDNDIRKGLPFVNKLGPLGSQLRAMTDQDIAKLKEEKQVMIQLKSLMRACEQVLQRVDELA